jgi:hypothetical protein
MRGLSMSAARYALLRLEEAQPHVKNWRPQILILVKTDQNMKIKHPNLIGLASQLKAGKGLTVSANVIAGDYIESLPFSKQSKQNLKDIMDEYKVKGFCDSLVAQNIEQGLCHLIQTEGLGGLRHNTIIMNWPQKFDKDDIEEKNSFTYHGFVNALRFANANESSIIITKGVDSWPVDKKNDCQSETIDIWWIIHDGGILLLIVFLLKKHKIWQKCKLRLFTVAQMQENSVQMKKDLMQYMYHLRIEAEVDVIEMPESEISAYTYEKTLKLEEREKLLKDFNLRPTETQSNEPQSTIDHVRRSSLIKTQKNQTNETTIPLLSENSINYKNSLTVTSSNTTTTSSSTSPRKLKENYKSGTIRKMHTAIELNKKIIEKSKNASLVLLNIPAPPKIPSAINDFSYMEYVNVLAEGLNRVLLVRGTGREVITIFS